MNHSRRAINVIKIEELKLKIEKKWKNERNIYGVCVCVCENMCEPHD